MRECARVVVGCAAVVFVGCSDPAASCPEVGPAIETDPMLGIPAEVTDENGCRVLKPRRRVDGAEVSRQMPWTKGGPVTIASGKGSVDVVGGSLSEVRVTYRPFVNAAPDAGEDEVRELLDSEDADIAITEFPGIHQAIGVGVFSHNGLTHYGADLRIELPPAFDGWLMIDQEAGPIRVAFSGASPRIEAVSTFGACELAIGPAVAELRVYCDGVDATLADVPPEISFRAINSFAGDVAVSFADVPEGRSFEVEASAAGGTVDTGDAASASCNVREIPAPGIMKVVRCGPTAAAAARYSVSATPPGNVVLAF